MSAIIKKLIVLMIANEAREYEKQLVGSSS
jgi:hypothetical protein